LVLLSAGHLARARARGIDLAAARRALADAASDEQRRIGDDLHDGVQQRLVGVLLHCRLAVPMGTATPAALLATVHHVLKALDGLRALSGSQTPVVSDAAPSAPPPRTEGVSCAPSSLMT
jgi:signal transduction histidine kinase